VQLFSTGPKIFIHAIADNGLQICDGRA